MSKKKQLMMSRLATIMLIVAGAVSVLSFGYEESIAQFLRAPVETPRIARHRHSEILRRGPSPLRDQHPTLADEANKFLRPNPSVSDDLPAEGTNPLHLRPGADPRRGLFSDSDLEWWSEPLPPPQPQQINWSSWNEMPSTIPAAGIVVRRDQIAGNLSLENYPGVVVPYRHFASARGPPRGPPKVLELLRLDSGLPYKDAVRALLIGPDQNVFGEYIKSPDGRYLLHLTNSRMLPNGSYEIRIVADGENSELVRSVDLAIKENAGVLPGFIGTNPDKLTLFIDKEKLGKKHNYTTYEVNENGIKFLRGVRKEIDRALVHYQKAHEVLSSKSSYELKWRVTLNYARSLHDAVLWYRYDHIADARQMYESLFREFQDTKNKGPLSPKLSDIGIKEEEILEPLRDLRALELQEIYVGASLRGGVEDLVNNIEIFINRYLADEDGMASRLQVSKEQMVVRLHLLKDTIKKLDRPALVERENGDYIVKSIDSSYKSSLHRFAELIDPEGRRATEYVIPRLEQAWLLNTVNELIARLGGER